MAFSAHSTDEEVKEYFDSDDKITNNVKELAKLIKESKHCVLYTGAGISTSSGISDFRGPNGVWTLRAKGQKPVSRPNFKMPTLAHMAVKRLVDEELVKYVVSQNTDGLHVRSGIPDNKIAELHGNTNKEFCKKCKKMFYRDFHTREAHDVHDHTTSRKCTCGEYLNDTIINFSESLPEEELKNGIDNSEKSDLAIVLGTSLRVSPACTLPSMKKKEGSLVICNLQKTPYDKTAQMVIHTQTDKLMGLLMQELGLPIPDFVFEFGFQVDLDETQKLIGIRNCSADLRSLLLVFKVVDSANKRFDMKSVGARRFEAKLSSCNGKSGVGLEFEFNLLSPFRGEVRLLTPGYVRLAINTNKNTLEHK
jgi:NAD-dependent SIR2 family protein deacetylase